MGKRNIGEQLRTPKWWHTYFYSNQTSDQNMEIIVFDEVDRLRRTQPRWLWEWFGDELGVQVLRTLPGSTPTPCHRNCERNRERPGGLRAVFGTHKKKAHWTDGSMEQTTQYLTRMSRKIFWVWKKRNIKSRLRNIISRYKGEDCAFADELLTALMANNAVCYIRQPKKLKKDIDTWVHNYQPTDQDDHSFGNLERKGAPHIDLQFHWGILNDSKAKQTNVLNLYNIDCFTVSGPRLQCP